MTYEPIHRPEEVASLFRSEDMTLVQLFIPSEIAQPTVAELGELGVVEFRDLNPDLNPFQRTYVNELRRLDEMERRLRFMWSQCDRVGISVRRSPRTPSVRARSQLEIDQLEGKLENLEGRIRQMNQSGETLNRRFLELTELRHVLRETAVFFEEARSLENEASHAEPAGPSHASLSADEQPLLSDLEGGRRPELSVLSGANLGFVTGVISRSKMGTFERILWRAFRGNLFMNAVEIDEVITDPITDEELFKNVFIIFAHGREILNKTRRLSESLGATLYPISEIAERRREDTLEVTARLEDLNEILTSTRAARRTELAAIAEEIDAWNVIISKEKVIYHSMGLFHSEQNRKAVVAEGWVPTPVIPRVQDVLKIAADQAGASVGTVLQQVRTHRAPPTYHRTNKLTKGFQGIVDAYGAARYQEVNPGLFTVITFPFLFACMFGDFGHGIMMAFVGAFLVWRERKLQTLDAGEIFDMLFDGRYIILLMGVFSIYVGAIYNDMFSRMMTFFASGWDWEVASRDGPTELRLGRQIGVYPFGVDFAWQDADNKLLFLNSLKMKMSVVLGVSHMLFGVFLNIYNHMHFKQRARVLAETLPQFLFMSAIFGYLVIMIFYKWCTDWTALNRTPPALLNMLIFMFLSPGKVRPEDQLYPGQATVQTLLLVIAFVCVPWMLLAWPLKERERIKEREAAGYMVVSGHEPRSSMPSELTSDTSHEGQEEHTFGEIMMHQLIHTIEFVLGTVSNTASYLRLWALSLAHAQLSEVLWDMVLSLSFNVDERLQPIAVVLMWGAWFSLTVIVLLIMEGLSAFLHALRLHWVEFNGKFYYGDGYLFTPFAFNRILKEMEPEFRASVEAAGAQAAQANTKGQAPPAG